MILASFKVQDEQDEITSIGGEPINQTVSNLCNTANSGYELEYSDNLIFVTFAWDGTSTDMITTNYTVSAKAHCVEINSSLVGGRPDTRFRPKPTA